MIYLDTHIAIFLCEGKVDSLSRKAAELIDQEHDLRISPMVILEFELLHEVKRIKRPAEQITAILREELGVSICTRSFPDVIRTSLTENWTRDPFDRIIAGHARLSDSVLITLDRTIQAHYKRAID